MLAKGIIVLEKIINGKLEIRLEDILNVISNGVDLHWSIIDLSIENFFLSNEKSISEFEDEIRKNENGYILPWKELCDLAQKFGQIIDATILASKNIEHIHKYKNTQEMFETCEIVIVMVDTTCWLLFTKDEDLYKKFIANFEVFKFIESDIYEKNRPAQKKPD